MADGHDNVRPSDALGQANGACGGHGAPANPPVGLTKNETLIWTTMRDKEGPLKAYEILDTLKEQGVRAPMTVYRGLEGLEAKGLVHKLEGINSFVLCNHEAPHKLQVFLVCEECPNVEEVDIEGLEGLVDVSAKRARFGLNMARLEMRGVCAECA